MYFVIARALFACKKIKSIMLVQNTLMSVFTLFEKLLAKGIFIY